MNTPTRGTNRIWPAWWRLGGVDGIVFVVLFIIGGIILQGDTPMHSDTAAEIKKFFVDNDTQYLVGDFILGIAFVLFFIPYTIALRWVLGSAEGSPPVWSWFSFAGAILLVALAGASGMTFSALALNSSNTSSLDDATLKFIVDMNLVGFTLATFAGALFVGSAGYVILRTGVLWRWLGALALIAAVLLVIGSAWPIQKDDEGALAIAGFIGLPLTFLFVLISSIGMIMRKEEPEVMVASG